MIELKAWTELKPSEEAEMVKETLRKIHPFEKLEVSSPDNKGTRKIHASTTGVDALEFLFSQARKQRIVQTLRNQLLSMMDLNNNSLEFMINKQALTRGLISFCNSERESPLGPVHIELSSNNIEILLNYLFPETENGKVLESSFIPRE